TIDLQGVAAFASLVELLSQELGSAPSRMQGQLPNGPSTFNELTGEIDLNGQGYFRRLTLLARPGANLTLRLQSAWSTGKSPQSNAITGGCTADYYLGGTVESIIPQGRALARYIEDIFQVLDRMVTLGQSSKLGSMNVGASEIQAFEASEGSMIRPHVAKAATSFDP
ncbi:MAG TPA: hypothetical protein V6C72_01210, partial [Chroococcales cyanobacterium]